MLPEWGSQWVWVYYNRHVNICELEFLAHSLVTQKSCKAKKWTEWCTVEKAFISCPNRKGGYIYIYIDWMMAGETTQNWRSRPNHEPTLSLSHNWQIQRSKKFAETICPFFGLQEAGACSNQWFCCNPSSPVGRCQSCPPEHENVNSICFRFWRFMNLSQVSLMDLSRHPSRPLPPPFPWRRSELRRWRWSDGKRRSMQHWTTHGAGLGCTSVVERLRVLSSQRMVFSRALAISLAWSIQVCTNRRGRTCSGHYEMQPVLLAMVTLFNMTVGCKRFASEKGTPIALQRLGMISLELSAASGFSLHLTAWYFIYIYVQFQ